MSTEAQTSTPARKPLPLYKRRRRRIYGAAALVLAVIVGVVVWATTGGSSGPAALPNFTISVSQGSVASPDSIIESQPSLAKLIPAHLHYVPFEAGVTAIAEMKSGAVQAISGVGNPPVTEAIGNGTGVTVVMGWGFDDDQLLVDREHVFASTVRHPGDLGNDGEASIDQKAVLVPEQHAQVSVLVVWRHDEPAVHVRMAAWF
jgi:hypothetical protein